MQEERRQDEDGDRVGPVEHPVETIEPATERKREHAEERHGDPEEVERRRIAGTAQPDGAADEQRERADRRQHEVRTPAPPGTGASRTSTGWLVSSRTTE